MEDNTSLQAPGWVACLTGDDIDLSSWERLLKLPFDPWCERIPSGGGLVFALHSRTFADAMSAGEVRERAMPLIARLNGVLGMIAGTERVNFDGVGHIDETGGIHKTAFETVRARGSAMMTATPEVRDARGNLIPPPPPEPSGAQRWAAAAEKDDKVADMLIYAGRADNWWDIYKAVELAECLSGGEHELSKSLGASSSECKNMRTTANYYRHARSHRPRVPTELTEAKGLLSFIVRTVLDKPGPM